MIFIKLNTGKTLNMTHISIVQQQDKNIIYKPAKGSLDDIVEYFNTQELATARYNELMEILKTE